jgi:hypothetical protein
MSAGRAEQDAREAEAFNIETEKVRSQANALQRHNDRLEQYRLNTKANLATFSATGRDIGRYNVKAFMERQKEITTQDTTRSDIMGMFESMKLAQAARTSRAEGRAAKQSATIRAYTGLVDSGIKFAEAGGFEKSSWKV